MTMEQISMRTVRGLWLWLCSKGAVAETNGLGALGDVYEYIPLASTVAHRAGC